MLCMFLARDADLLMLPLVFHDFGPEMTEDEIVEIAGTLKDPRSPPPSMPSEDEHSPYNVLDSDDGAAVCDDTPFMVLDSDDSTVDE